MRTIRVTTLVVSNSLATSSPVNLVAFSDSFEASCRRIDGSGVLTVILEGTNTTPDETDDWMKLIEAADYDDSQPISLGDRPHAYRWYRWIASSPGAATAECTLIGLR